MNIQHRIIAATLLLLLAACTDGRSPLVVQEASNLPNTGPLLQVANVQFGGQNTAVNQMQVAYGSLFLTGTPFVFARWDITASPESPHQTFAASDNVSAFSPDPPFGGWIVSEFGAGAMGIFGNFALTSGSFGASVIQVGPSVQTAQEVARYPMLGANGDQAADVSFEFKAAVPIPSSPYIYGFTEQDGVYLLNASNPANISRIPLNLPNSVILPYSNNGPVCCATGAALLGNKIFLGMRSQLWVITVSQATATNGVPFTLGRVASLPGAMASLNPVGVFATNRYVYIHHELIPGSNGARPGIYVFDQNFNQVNFFPIQPLSFAVSPDDVHVYSNEDDLSVKIYRLQ